MIKIVLTVIFLQIIIFAIEGWINFQTQFVEIAEMPSRLWEYNLVLFLSTKSNFVEFRSFYFDKNYLYN